MKQKLNNVFSKIFAKRFRKNIFFAVFITTALGIGGIIYFNKFIKSEEVHYHAGFQVYVDGELVDFSADKYMKEDPCVVAGTEVKEDEQLEKAHLHDHVGTVVHVERTRAVWGDLFKNIRYSFDTQKPMVSYVNGEEVKDILRFPIKTYDSVVIIVGEHEDIQSYLRKSIQKTEILDAENKSEDCGT